MSKASDMWLMVAAAERYAKADNSDPFAYARAMAHLRNGVAEYSNKDGQATFYSAELHYEPRAIKMPNGQVLEWQAEVYRNRFRP
jgi:hypothetical protein